MATTTKKKKTTATAKARRRRPAIDKRLSDLYGFKVPPVSKQLMVRTSERTSFKRCHWAWARGFIDHLKPIQEAPALRFGTLIHAALEERYPVGKRRGPKPAETFLKLYAEETERAYAFGFSDEDGQWAQAEEIGHDMMVSFIEEYGRDEEWEVVSSERTFQVPVADPETGLYLFTYVGTMDGVWRNRMDGAVRVIDWKTTKNDPTKTTHLILDEQATGYWTWGVDALIAEGVMKPRHVEALDGMLYTFMRKAKKDERPRNKDGLYLNKDGSISAKQPSPLFHRELVYRSEVDREKARTRAVAEVRDMLEIRRGEKEPYKAPHFINCAMCQYRDLCELDEIGGDYDGLKKATMTTWDPYSAHEIATEGR